MPQERISSLRLVFAWCSLAVGWAVGAAYCLGAAVNDRFVWSQFLWWIPTIVALVGVGIPLCLAHLFTRNRKKPTVLRIFKSGLVALALGMLVSFCFLECRLQNAMADRSVDVQTDIRIFYWNPSIAAHEENMRGTQAVEADIAVITNTSSMDADPPFLHIAGRDKDRATEWVHISRYEIGSRFPILRFGKVSLGLRGRRSQLAGTESPTHPETDVDVARRFSAAQEQPEESEDWRTVDRGEAAFVEFDIGKEKPLVIWLIDMPSDPRLSREAAMKAASRAIATWNGPVRSVRDDGTKFTVSSGAAGFPSADVIMGDFNAPRGSRSLRALTANHDNTFAAGGLGWPGSFTRRWPLLHIDLMFTAPDWRAVRYEIGDPGDGWHRYQWCALRARKQ